MKKLQFILSDGINLPVEVNYSPQGWSDSIINRTRNDNYYSVSEKFTTQLTFIEDGAEYLRNLFYTKGIDAYCKLTITQLNHRTLQYVTIYEGNVDFSTFIDNRFSIKANINDGSFWETIKANEKTDYLIDIESNNPVLVDADFPALEEKISSICSINQTLTGLCILGFQNLIYESALSSLSYYNNQTASNVSLPYSQPTYLVEKTVSNASIYFYGDVSIGVQNTSSVTKVRLLVSVWNGVTNTFYSIQDFIIPAFNNYTPINFTISSSVLLNLNVGDFISINTILTDVSNNPVAGLNYILNGDIYHDLLYSSYPPAKQIKALRVSTVFGELLKKINNDVALNYDTSFFNTINDYVITSGDAIRGFTDAKIKTNLSDFFHSLNSIFGCGFGYEDGKAWMDFKSHFFQDIEIKNFGEVSDFELTVFRNWIYNAANIGYEEQTYDDVNGRYEFNQSQNWSLPIKKVIKKEEIISKYRADIYGIIFTSLNLEGKTTTDSENDNDVFIIHTKTQNSTTFFNRDFDINSVQGFPDPSKLFNHKLSPKRCLINNSDFFNSFLNKNTNDIKFTSGLKNVDLVVKANDEVAAIKESENLIYTELKNSLFLPYNFSFNVIIESDFNEFINQNQNGYVRFTYKGVELKGFIYDVGVNPAQNTKYQLKLIAHPDCDLTQII